MQNHKATVEAASWNDACGQAMNLQLAGHWEGAERLYREVLHEQPDHAVANHCLGMLHVQRQQPAQGLPFLMAALNAHPELPDYWLGYLEALLQAGQLDVAQETLALARQHGLSGKSVDAFALRLLADEGTQRAPELELQRLVDQKRFDEALVLASRTTQRLPDHGLSWKTLGALLWWKGRFDEALLPLQTAVRLLPSDAEAHSNFGMALLYQKNLSDAVTNFRRAIALNPRFAAAHYHLGMAHLQEERYAEGEASLRTAVDLRPDYLTTDSRPVHAELLPLYSHNSTFGADALFAEHCKYGDYFEASLRAAWPAHTPTADPERALKIGWVSGDLLDHSVATFLEPVIARLSGRPDLTMIAYHNRAAEDAVTARLRGYFDHWHAIAELGDADLAARIVNDGIDILIDLSGHTALNRLRTFARKPAPIQVSWLGYPGTTGLQGMDYYLADPCWLAPGRFDRLFTEKLVYLPDRWAFQPHPEAPAVGPLPALASGRLTFGSFHRLGKINSASIELWSQLLLGLPQSILLIVGIPPRERDSLRRKFATRGLTSERLEFHDRCRMPEYLALHHRVDLCLDTQPYAGATTSMHSLSMGVPTLTVAGATAAAQACAGILRHVGLESFIAQDAADFVRKGRYWAGHLPELAALRAELRPRLARSPAGQPDLIAAHLERALRHMWRRWCTGLPAESFDSTTLAQPAPSPKAPMRPREQRSMQRLADAATASVAQGRYPLALSQAARLTERFPDYGRGWKILGAVLWSEGRTDEALTAMQTAARLLPQDAEAHGNLGISLAAVERHDAAAMALRRTLAIDPTYAAAHYRLGMYHELQGRYREAEVSIRAALSLPGKFLSVDPERAFSNLLYLLDYSPDIDAEALAAEHRRYAARFETPRRATWPRHANLRQPERRLRIGFVSGDLRDHAVATFLEPVLAALAHGPDLALHAFANRATEDAVSARLRGYFDHWHAIAELSDADLTARIASEGIDILIDLAGHTAENRLAAFTRKPAPIQVSWLGYPGTTGLQGMDYYLADPCWLAPGRFDRLFTEKLVYLPDRWAFQPHADAPAVGPLPALESGRLTFGSFHRPGKINSASIELWSQLLQALPDSALLLGGIAQGSAQNSLRGQFSALGVEPERLEFHDRCRMPEYLALHHRVDLCLDTQPYAGATTSMHSLSMGVPTLTVAGATAAAQACAGILRHVGLESFIAQDAADFVRKGRYWAGHLPELAALRAELRPRLARSPAGQPDLIAAHLEGALRHMWRRWCAGLPAESFHSARRENLE